MVYSPPDKEVRSILFTWGGPGRRTAGLATASPSVSVPGTYYIDVTHLSSHVYLLGVSYSTKLKVFSYSNRV